MFKADEIIEKRDRERGREGEREARVSAVRAPDHCGSAQMRFYMPTNLNYIFFFFSTPNTEFIPGLYGISLSLSIPLRLSQVIRGRMWDRVASACLSSLARGGTSILIGFLLRARARNPLRARAFSLLRAV